MIAPASWLSVDVDVILDLGAAECLAFPGARFID
jgi:hypothetical protein